MRGFVRTVLRYRVIALIGMAAWLAAGTWALLRLDIEAYPDPAPPLVDVITQNPSWSAEEMEQQVTVPIETALNGISRLQYVRSISLFGLSDVKLYFDFDSDYFRDRQEVLNRLQTVTLPQNLEPQLSPWSAVGEIYRYQLKGNGYSLNDIKAIQDWFVRRELKQVAGIVDVTTFGGTTKQYQAEIDPQKLLQYNVTLPQMLAAISASNQNAGGNYLEVGTQNVNVRGLGLLKGVTEMGVVLIAERNGAPVFLRDIADVHEGYQPPLGRVGRDADNNIVKGTVLLQRGEQSLPALEGLRNKIHVTASVETPLQVASSHTCLRVVPSEYSMGTVNSQSFAERSPGGRAVGYKSPPKEGTSSGSQSGRRDHSETASARKLVLADNIRSKPANAACEWSDRG